MINRILHASKHADIFQEYQYIYSTDQRNHSKLSPWLVEMRELGQRCETVFFCLEQSNVSKKTQKMTLVDVPKIMQSPCRTPEYPNFMALRFSTEYT